MPEPGSHSLCYLHLEKKMDSWTTFPNLQGPLNSKVKTASKKEKYQDIYYCVCVLLKVLRPRLLFHPQSSQFFLYVFSFLPILNEKQGAGWKTVPQSHTGKFLFCDVFTTAVAARLVQTQPGMQPFTYIFLNLVEKLILRICTLRKIPINFHCWPCLFFLCMYGSLKHGDYS